MADLNIKVTAMKKIEILTFASLVGRNLLDQGAIIIDSFQASVFARRGKHWHLQTNKFSLDTICGELHIIVYDGWIACRFQDVDLAKRKLPVDLQANLNRFSGKWNFHFFRWTPQDAARDFEHAISRILPSAVNIEGASA
jgi:hypothetical protein